MKKLRKPLIALAVVAAVLVLAAYVTRPREPVYEGKRLSEWLEQIRSEDEAEMRHGVAAIRAIGTNALPALMEMLDSRDSSLKLWIQRLPSKQSLITWKMASADDRKVDGLIGLSVLGESSRPALPKMKALFVADAPGSTWGIACAAIADCEPDVVGYFTACLTNPIPRVRHASAQRLGFMREKARTAVPQLIVALKDDNHVVRKYAARSLGLIDNESEHVLSLLIPMLDDPDYHVRSGAAVGIGEFGSRAQSAVEQLRLMTVDTNETVRISATTALKKIMGADSERSTPEVSR